MKALTIDICKKHKFYAISIEDPESGTGIRVTPAKCCGRWDTIKVFQLSASAWKELSELASEAANEAAE